MSELQKGDRAPGFELADTFGNSVRLVDFKGKKLLIYFFPKAGTSGCTKQTEAVRDALAQLKALGADALGISPDPLAAQKKFSDRLALNFPLLSDPEHIVADAYGVWGEKSMYGKKYFGIVRSSFLIDERGDIAAAWYRISPDKTVPEALKALSAR